MSVLKKLWLGQYPLPVAFWLFYVAGFFAMFFLAGAVLLTSYHLRLGTIGFIVGFAIIWFYWLVASVGVWRSAGVNVASPIWITKAWGLGARGIVLIFALRAFWTLANGGALALMERMTARMGF